MQQGDAQLARLAAASLSSQLANQEAEHAMVKLTVAGSHME
jgi:hypothetical protein